MLARSVDLRPGVCLTLGSWLAPLEHAQARYNVISLGLRKRLNACSFENWPI
jgi:hypothetical protein